MAGKRTVYQNWIVELGREPGQFIRPPSESEISPDLEREVNAAIELLDAEEREFIVRFHFMGQGYKEISELSGRAIYKLASIHKRAIKRLRLILSSFVSQRYGIKPTWISNCPICQSDRREQIDQLLESKSEESTWRPIIRRLREEFDIIISTPQQLIGHAKYHHLHSETRIREAQ